MKNTMKNIMTLVNLTPHAINFVNAATGVVIMTVAPSGAIARCATQTVDVGEILGLPVTATSYGEVQDLPEPTEGVAYIVSALVAGRVPERDDVFIPGGQVRDDQGRVIGCTSLGRVG